MASSPSSLLLPLSSTSGKSLSFAPQGIPDDKVRCLAVRYPSLDLKVKSTRTGECAAMFNNITRRDFLGLAFGVPSLFMNSFDAKGAGLPPEEKPRLCDDTCQKELENVPMITTESGLQYKDIKVGQGSSPPVGFQAENSVNINERHYPIHAYHQLQCLKDRQFVYQCNQAVAANYVAMVPSGQIFDSSLEKGQPYIFRVGSGQVIKGLDEGILSMKIGGKRRLYIPGSLAFPKGLSSAPGRPRVAPNSPVIFDVSLEYIPGLELDEE